MAVKLLEAIDTEALFLPEGWEIKVAATAEEMTGEAAGAGVLLDSDPKTGKVTAIVGVTGIVDHVADLIEPGAYKDTLAKRRPKVCWAHDWEKPVGKVLRIEEWLPGDPRFAEVGATLQGKAWPAEAGALVAEMQFNMKSERGRETFAAVEFYSESNECEWSIGWQTIPGKTLRRKDGVRVCKSVELFEMSPVLFGAAPLTRTLEVKSINLAQGTIDAMLRKAEAHANGEDEDHEPDDAERKLHADALDEVDWAEVDAAITGGSAPAKKVYAEQVVVDLSVLAGETPDFGALAKSLEGIEVKAAEGGADRNRGNAEELRRWYEEGEGAAKIRWGQDGDFMRCVKIASKHMDPERAKGYCNLRHHGALGVYPGQEHGKSAGQLAAEAIADSWNPLLEVGADAAHREGKALEEKHLGDGGLVGTWEQRLDAVRRAVNRRIMELNGWDADDEDDAKRPSDAWVSIDGTYDDRVIATYVKYGVDDTRTSYEVPYARVGGEVVLGEPVQVELTIQVVPVEGGDEPTADEVEGALLAPAGRALDVSISAVKAALAHTSAIETKAGRVLSEANSTRIRAAIEHLIAVVQAAGVQIEVGEPKPVSTTTPDSTAPSANGGVTEIKTLDPAEVASVLAGL